MGIMVASIISFHATDVVVVPVFVLLLGIVLYDIERKTLQTFIGWENHEQQAREMFLSERVQDDMKNEQIQMKVIIGNLAHDMKTPMQALVLDLNELREELYTYTGMEPYTDDEDDYSLCNETANLSSCGNTVFKPLQTVAALKRTVGFMNMTIHRAIDYRKASCGLPLVPNMTTIHIPSTVNWAVSLTTSEQDSVKTSIYPISPRVCPYIISDKQWLSENILCLLSNAHRYTCTGEIALQVYITRDIVPPSEGGKSSTVQLGSLNSTSKSRNSVQTPPPSPSSRFVPTPIDVKSERRFEALEMNERGMWGGDNTFVVVEVYDTGIGVPDSEKGYLFQPYGQTRRLTGGTGLGLYCLMKRMEALGGVCGMRDRIVQRADGQNVVEGSCFWFAVPYIPDYTGGNSERSSGRLLRVTPKSLNCSYKEPVDNAIGSTIEICPDDGNSSTISDIGENTRSQPASTVCSSASHPHVTTDEIPVSEPASHPIPSSISLNLPDDVDVSHSLPEEVNVEVLLVDDAIVVQKSTSRMLRKAGYRVSIAQNGRIALDMMKKQLYAFVLMDIQMPVMDGIESTHLLREYESQSSLGERQIIIGLSANSDDDTRKEALTAGMNAFIPKPLAVKMLQRCLRECNVSTQ
eukprot:CAMPEP_0185032030 /NCGR_PEP_ID=MMETSP1103-20130426/19843_1 /TAXON_ID=36769 /ORGANISM="Paraphysomonas bandaiensis, Strain Caron Lab Isolate" /LENGTH=634 /DNA_ID=CAMNT_0027567767 /DNA_START=578 /DNA_END=2482 /DNA_ORIENTATION=+